MKISVPPEQLRDHIFRTREKHIAQHGRGRAADRAYLHEILTTVENLPGFLRGRMQLAFNRHTMMEHRERYEKATQEATAQQATQPASSDSS